MKKKAIVLAALIVSFVLASSGTAHAALTWPLMPILDGSYRSWIPSPRQPHFMNVDDYNCNGLTDLNFTTATGSRDSFVIDLSTVPNGRYIVSVLVSPCASYMPLGRLTTNPILKVFTITNGIQSSDYGNYVLNSLMPIQLATTTIPIGMVKEASTTIEVGAVYSAPLISWGIGGIRLSNLTSYIDYR